MNMPRLAVLCALLISTLSGCGGGHSDPATSASTSARVMPAVNPAFETLSEVAVSAAAGGPYQPLPAAAFEYSAADETLSIHELPAATAMFVRILGLVDGTRYLVYTQARGGQAVAANELTSIAVGLVADGTAADFAGAVDSLAADPLLAVGSNAITEPVGGAQRDPRLAQLMRTLAPRFVDDPDIAGDQFEPGVDNPRAILETLPVMRSVAMGALAYDRWWSTEAGGVGRKPPGEPVADYLRCSSCHGWDQLGTDGGYARRTRAPERPNAGFQDANFDVSRNIAGGQFGVDEIVHAGRGRTWEQGSASWDGSPGGFSTGNRHPDYALPGGLSDEQVDHLAAFLNAASLRATAVFEQIRSVAQPVDYVLRDDASADRGHRYYERYCMRCHGAPGADSTSASRERPGAGGLLAYLDGDGRPSEFMHKVRWGLPDSAMSRAAMGYPSARDVADLLAYLAEPDAPATPAPGGGGGAGEGGDAALGQLAYDEACALCHKAGEHDPSGSASDLAAAGDRLVADLGALNPVMGNLSLSAQQLRDLAAFLDGLASVDFAAVDDTASTAFETPAVIDVLANDIGANLAIVAWDGLTDQGASVVCADSCTYTPASAFSGADRFSYTISDGTRSATAVVDLVVRAASGGGDVNAGRLLYDRDCALCHRAGSYDTQGANADLLGAAAILVPDLGGLDAAMTGLVLDASALADLAAFLDSLSGVAFAAVDDVASTTPDQAVDIDVLANDIGSGLAIIAWDAQSAQGGTVECALVCRYTPATGFSGSDEFTYTLNDGSNTASATVQIVVRTPGGPDPNAGRLVYDGDCAVCHRAGDYDTSGPNSDLAFRTALLIADLGRYSSAMSGLVLETQAVEDLRAFLVSLNATPTTPAELYEAYCASCHGANGSGGSGGRLGAESAREIAEAIDEEAEMALPSLTRLSAADLDAIAGYLAEVASGGD